MANQRMTLYSTFSIIIVMAAIMAHFNQRFLKLPNSIGVMIIAIVVSGILIMVNRLFPQSLGNTFSLIDSVDFSTIVIGIMLNFLLFAGTISLRIHDLRKQLLPVALFSTISVVLSTFLIGFLMYWTTGFFHLHIPLLHCLLFGALISPTDPVSVLGIFKDVRLNKSLQTTIAGESVFNDGVSLVIFFTIFNVIHNPSNLITFREVSVTFLRESVGGLLLGAGLGFVGVRALKVIDDYKIEVMITLAIVMGGSTLAALLHLSSPLSMVSAGIFVGNYGKIYAMNEVSVDYMEKFWELVEEILNVVLFVLIGFELINIKHFQEYWAMGIFAILITLVSRFVSIFLPSVIVNFRGRMSVGTVGFLTWGGLRGAISIALALNLSYVMHREFFVYVTYCVVVFSIIVQGLSIRKVVEVRNKKIESDEADENVTVEKDDYS